MTMASLLTVSSLLLLAASVSGTTYQPTWESLDSRPSPDWFYQDKFGMLLTQTAKH